MHYEYLAPPPFNVTSSDRLGHTYIVTTHGELYPSSEVRRARLLEFYLNGMYSAVVWKHHPPVLVSKAKLVYPVVSYPHDRHSSARHAAVVSYKHHPSPVSTHTSIRSKGATKLVLQLSEQQTCGPRPTISRCESTLDRHSKTPVNLCAEQTHDAMSRYAAHFVTSSVCSSAGLSTLTHPKQRLSDALLQVLSYSLVVWSEYTIVASKCCRYYTRSYNLSAIIAVVGTS